MPLPSLEIIKQFNTPYFVETGTCNGSSLFKIIKMDKFEKIFSVEALQKSPYHDFDFVQKQCDKFNNVYLTLDDSTHYLKTLIPNLDKPTTFWLDAHYAGTAPKHAYEKPTPLYDELLTIKNSKINEHVIMIDDVRDFGLYGVTKETIETVLYNINPEYNIYYTDCKAAKNDVLIATLKNLEI